MYIYTYMIYIYIYIPKISDDTCGSSPALNTFCQGVTGPWHVLALEVRPVGHLLAEIAIEHGDLFDGKTHYLVGGLEHFYFPTYWE